jgi:hypothetical protein
MWAQLRLMAVSYPLERPLLLDLLAPPLGTSVTQGDPLPWVTNSPFGLGTTSPSISTLTYNRCQHRFRYHFQHYGHHTSSNSTFEDHLTIYKTGPTHNGSNRLLSQAKILDLASFVAKKMCKSEYTATQVKTPALPKNDLVAEQADSPR